MSDTSTDLSTARSSHRSPSVHGIGYQIRLERKLTAKVVAAKPLPAGNLALPGGASPAAAGNLDPA